LATAVRHTVTRSAVANMPPDARVVSGNVEAVLAYYDPLRGKQQGLGTKLPHAKTRRLPGCACACPHNITLIGGARTIVTSPPEYGWFPRAPELKPGTTRPGG